MVHHVDHTPDGTAVGRCIVLPGSRYTPDGPMLFFATQVALDRGWDVRQVWWEVPELASDADEAAWVSSRLDAALDGYEGRVLVVAKSLGTLAAPVAAARGYDAAWLTPLLGQPDVAAALSAWSTAQLVVIGDRDPRFRQDVLDGLPGECLVVPGDHVLRVPGDAAATVASHDRFVRTFDAWLAGLRPRS